MQFHVFVNISREVGIYVNNDLFHPSNIITNTEKFLWFRILYEFSGHFYIFRFSFSYQKSTKTSRYDGVFIKWQTVYRCYPMYTRRLGCIEALITTEENGKR